MEISRFTVRVLCVATALWFLEGVEREVDAHHTLWAVLEGLAALYWLVRAFTVKFPQEQR